jgi:hypothetical protein
MLPSIYHKHQKAFFSGAGAGCLILVGPSIPPFDHHLGLLVCPRIQIRTLDTTDVRPEAAMNAAAADTDEHTEGPGRPARVRVDMAIRTHPILRPFHQVLPQLALKTRCPVHRRCVARGLWVL